MFNNFDFQRKCNIETTHPAILVSKDRKCKIEVTCPMILVSKNHKKFLKVAGDLNCVRSLLFFMNKVVLELLRFTSENGYLENHPMTFTWNTSVNALLTSTTHNHGDIPSLYPSR